MQDEFYKFLFIIAHSSYCIYVYHTWAINLTMFCYDVLRNVESSHSLNGSSKFDKRKHTD